MPDLQHRELGYILIMVSVLGLVIVVCFLQAKGDACGVLTINDGKDDGASLLKKTISAFNQKCRAGKDIVYLSF